MLIIGCDYHAGFQQIAFVDTDSGEFEERRLPHREEAETSGGLIVRSLYGDERLPVLSRHMTLPITINTDTDEVEASSTQVGRAPKAANLP